jgi:D-alanyl-D-alanine carboxypeptidase
MVAISAVALAVIALAGCAPARSPYVASTLPGPQQSSTPTQTQTPTPTPTATALPDRTPKVKGFDKSAHSIDNPNSIWVVSDKLRPLKPIDYTPPDIVTVPVAHANPPRLRKAASAALVTMFAAAKNSGGGAMQIQSAWRAYSVQVSVYNGWVNSLGKKQADRQSARPGFSEHQTGLAVDISSVPATCSLATCFGTTVQGKWLKANAWKFGYLLRYPSNKEKVTGFQYEPWHFRYIGVPLSTEMHKEGITTLEEFFGLPAAPDYKN